MGTTTNDFKTYTPTVQLSQSSRLNLRETVLVSGNSESGTVHKVSWSVIENLLNKKALEDFKATQNNESVKDDPIRFSDLKPLDATVTVKANESKKISDLLTGIFFEDINYSADGGLYAELIQNRDFEYSLADKEGRDKSWTSTKAWSLANDKATLNIDTLLPIHSNNKHYIVLNIDQPGGGLVNEGFDGIALKAGDKYDFSIFVISNNST
jgi:hypothetical protein